MNRLALFVNIFQTVIFNGPTADDAEQSLQGSHVFTSNTPEALNEFITTPVLVKIKTAR